MKEGERSPFEAEKKLQMAKEIDDLLCRLETESDEEVKKNLESEIRDKIKRYRKILGQADKEEVTEYYKRLEDLKKIV